jgi:hypothetical protein
LAGRLSGSSEDFENLGKTTERRPDFTLVGGTLNGFLEKILWVLALVAGLSGLLTAQTDAKPAPSLYVSEKFGLVMKVPSGLSFCALPKGWSGEETGTVLFLQPPQHCRLSDGSSAIRAGEGFYPSISLRYQVNRRRDDAYDGEIAPPQSSEEFARQFCMKPLVSPDAKLFEQPTFTCRSEMSGKRIQIALMNVYDSARKNVILTLHTTPDRLAEDTKILATVASSISTCQMASVKDKSGATACPEGNWW